jgi:hypothetical protein
MYCTGVLIAIPESLVTALEKLTEAFSFHETFTGDTPQALNLTFSPEIIFGVPL